MSHCFVLDFLLLVAAEVLLVDRCLKMDKLKFSKTTIKCKPLHFLFVIAGIS